MLNIAAWDYFFRIGYLIFVVLCTAAGLVFCGHLVIAAFWRLIGSFYDLQAMLEALRINAIPAQMPKALRAMRFWAKHDL